MDRTAVLDLPLVQAAQAQKHVTVNEALVRLDSAVQLVVLSRTELSPPETAAEGAVYAVPAGATGSWATEVGRLAVRDNGGWSFVTPARGWRAWLADAGVSGLFDGQQWVPGGLAMSPAGAASLFEVLEIEVPLSAESAVTTSPFIPRHAVLFGVSGVVTEAIAGTTGWRVGLPGASGKFGNSLGIELGSSVRGPAIPEPIWEETGLLVEAEGGSFSAGSVRLAAHVFRMTIPRV